MNNTSNGTSEICNLLLHMKKIYTQTHT